MEQSFFTRMAAIGRMFFTLLFICLTLNGVVARAQNYRGDAVPTPPVAGRTYFVEPGAALWK